MLVSIAIILTNDDIIKCHVIKLSHVSIFFKRSCYVSNVMSTVKNKKNI